jgi:hypothetical protein
MLGCQVIHQNLTLNRMGINSLKEMIKYQLKLSLPIKATLI